MNPGIYENLSAADYHAAPGLSNSDLKLFLVSPLHYWHVKKNPALECLAWLPANGAGRICGAPRGEHPTATCRYFQGRQETAALKLGSALHVAVLEPDTFLDRYALKPNAADFPEAIDTVKQMQDFLTGKGIQFKKSALKPELEAQAIAAGAPLLSTLMKQQAAADHGKTYLDKAEWQQVYGMSAALRRESALKPYLEKGVGEVSFFQVDPETGVLLKCRLDWLSALRCVVDLKSMAARDEPIDRTVSRAIVSREYYRQPWFYLHVMALAGYADFSWLYAFVESDAPYEVRLRSMGPSGVRGLNKYWVSTGDEVRAALKRFAEYEREFGDLPWAYHQAIEPVRDSELAWVKYTSGHEGEE